MRLGRQGTALAVGLMTAMATSASAAPGPAAVGAYVGEVRAFAFNFCPQGWLPADGRTLTIIQNQVLFSLIGVSFGGNGVSTFALPDLRGRGPTGASPSIPLGQVGSVQSGTTARFVAMTWCIAVDAAVPPEAGRTQPQR